jgi:hypothetical protein
VRFGGRRQGQPLHPSWHERSSGKKLVHLPGCLGQLGGGGAGDKEPRHRQVPGLDATDRHLRASPHSGHQHGAPPASDEIGCQVEGVVIRGVAVHVDLTASSIPQRAGKIGVAIVEGSLGTQAAALVGVSCGRGGEHPSAGVHGDHDRSPTHMAGAAGDQHRLARPELSMPLLRKIYEMRDDVYRVGLVLPVVIGSGR